MLDIQQARVVVAPERLLPVGLVLVCLLPVSMSHYPNSAQRQLTHLIDVRASVWCQLPQRARPRIGRLDRLISRRSTQGYEAGARR